MALSKGAKLIRWERLSTEEKADKFIQYAEANNAAPALARLKKENPCLLCGKVIKENQLFYQSSNRQKNGHKHCVEENTTLRIPEFESAEPLRVAEEPSSPYMAAKPRSTPAPITNQPEQLSAQEQEELQALRLWRRMIIVRSEEKDNVKMREIVEFADKVVKLP